MAAPRAGKRGGRPATGRVGTTFGAFVTDEETVWRPVRDAFEPTYTTTAEILDGLRAIERADHELATSLPGDNGVLARIRRATLQRNAFATASIEGNPLTLAEVESLLAAPATPGGAASADELEILNYAAFMTSPAAERAPRRTADVAEVHARFFDGVFRDAGQFKKDTNFIGSRSDRRVVYVPAAAERVKPELQNALDWLHDATTHPPLARAFLFHHEFESIHPFRDGNGRAGRALTPMILAAFGYPGVAYAPLDYRIYGERKDYFANLAAVERNGFEDYTPWLAYMTRTTRAAYEDAVTLARFHGALPPDLPARQRSVADWFAQLARASPERRVKFADVHRAFPDVPARTLKRDLSALRDGGVLDAQGERRGTSYRLKSSQG
ncbi:MAG TPA: Fic family protein [Candidatus Thermoplasmatota archaeon]|nr:Fic family protein [Candidatus Thermoplasmatota archaeon]